MLKCQTKKVEGSKLKADSSRSLKVRKTSLIKKKRRLQRNPDPPSDYESDADEYPFEWSNILIFRAYFLEDFGEDLVDVKYFDP